MIIIITMCALQVSSSSSDTDADPEVCEQRASTRFIDTDTKNPNVVYHLGHGRLYNEITIFLSKNNRYSIHMGIKPELSKKSFHREMRISDARVGSSLSINMFQFVRMLNNFKSALWSNEKYYEFCNSDEKYMFTYNEIKNSLRVETMGISIGGHQTKYKVNLLGRRDKYVLFDEESLHSFLDMERDIIKIYRALDPVAVEAKFRKLLPQCVELCKDVVAEKRRKVVAAFAFESEDTFATETVLKFWDLLHQAIFHEILGYESAAAN